MIVRELIAKFGLDVEGKGFKEGDAAVSRLAGKAAVAFAAAAAAGAGLLAFGNRMAAAGDRFDKVSKQLGISATGLRAWEHAAAISGVSSDQLSAGLTGLANNIRGVQEGSKQYIETFKRLGVNIRDSSGEFKSMDALLMDVGSSIGALDNDTEKAAVAQKVFGRSGRALIPLFNEGAEGMAKLREEVFALYGKDGFDEFTETSAEYTDAVERMNLVKQQLYVTIANQILPAFTKISGWIKSALPYFTKFSEAVNLGMLALMAVAAVGAVSLAILIKSFSKLNREMLPTYLTVAIITAGFIAIGLLIEDFYRLLTGGKSVIGEFIDSWLGVGSASAFVTQLKKDVDALLGTLEKGKELLGLFKDFVGGKDVQTGGGATAGGQGLRGGIAPSIPASARYGTQNYANNVAAINVTSPDPAMAGEAVKKALQEHNGWILNQVTSTFAQPG